MGELNLEEYKVMVSVALIVYNHEKYLRQAIESILMQKVNFEYQIIVGEDKSTDSSREVLLEYKEKYPDKFILIFNDQNVGGTKNSYNIFQKAAGKYIACLEGDDYWIDEYKLQKQVDFLEENGEYLGVSHIIEARDLEGRYLSRYPKSRRIVGKDVTSDLFLQGHYFSAVATVYRNIYLNKSCDFSILYKAHKYIGDFTLCMLLLDNGRIRILDEVMSVYRCRSIEGESNYNSLRNPIQQYNDHILLINAINEYFKYKYDFTREYLERSISIFIYAIRYNEFRNFLSTLKLIPNGTIVMFALLLPLLSVKKVIKKIFS